MINEMSEKDKKYLNDVFYSEDEVKHLLNGKTPSYDIKGEEILLKTLEKKGVKLSQKQKKEYLKSFTSI